MYPYPYRPVYIFDYLFVVSYAGRGPRSDAVVHVCDVKVPATSRLGQPFESTLQAWLALVLLPKLRRAARDNTGKGVES